MGFGKPGPLKPVTSIGLGSGNAPGFRPLYQFNSDVRFANSYVPLSSQEIRDLIPPNAQGVFLNADGKSLTIWTPSGYYIQSLLKPNQDLINAQNHMIWANSMKKIGLDPDRIAAAVLLNPILQRQGNASFSYSVADFNKDQSNSESFYRAMSLTELFNTGGDLSIRPGKGSYPFITSNLLYLTNRNSLVWDQSSSYDVIVKYSMPSGTLARLLSVGVNFTNNLDFDKVKVWNNSQVVLKIETYTTVGGARGNNMNYGFPNQAGDKYFNPYILEKKIILAKYLKP
jgi:hypothetical protein